MAMFSDVVNRALARKHRIHCVLKTCISIQTFHNLDGLYVLFLSIAYT